MLEDDHGGLKIMRIENTTIAIDPTLLKSVLQIRSLLVGIKSVLVWRDNLLDLKDALCDPAIRSRSGSMSLRLIERFGEISQLAAASTRRFGANWGRRNSRRLHKRAIGRANGSLATYLRMEKETDHDDDQIGDCRARDDGTRRCALCCGSEKAQTRQALRLVRAIHRLQHDGRGFDAAKWKLRKLRPVRWNRHRPVHRVVQLAFGRRDQCEAHLEQHQSSVNSKALNSKALNSKALKSKALNSKAVTRASTRT
jgi:hypothetical protein